jgi:hypothetical protein
MLGHFLFVGSTPLQSTATLTSPRILTLRREVKRILGIVEERGKLFIGQCAAIKERIGRPGVDHPSPNSLESEVKRSKT